MDDITSLQNARVKEAAKLRDRRQRRKQGRFLIDGARELRRAIEAGVELTEVFICDALCHSTDCSTVLAKLATLATPQARVTAAVFEKLAFGDRAEGVLAVAQTPHRSLADLKLPERPLLVVLEGVEKPGNIGAILRSADAAGLSAVIVAGRNDDLYNPNTVRASLGTIFTVPVYADDSAAIRDWLIARKIAIFTARVDAHRLYTAADLRGPTAIVLGSEAEGLSPVWTAANITAVRLPMHGAADSLNVSATAAVLFYEALRQRGG